MGRYLNFTKRGIESLPLPKGKPREFYFDTETKGLRLAVYPTGRRTFYHIRKANGREECSYIGEFPDLSIENARTRAEELNSVLARRRLVGFTQEETLAPDRCYMTLETLLQHYLDRHIKPRPGGEKAAKEIDIVLRRHVSDWFQRRVLSIQRNDIVDLHWKLGEKSGQYLANRVVVLLRAVFNYGIEQELFRGSNPVRNVTLYPEQPRDRYLKPEEMPKLFEALADEQTHPDLRDYVLLALFTGARKHDVLSMRWQDVSFALSTWRVPDPKNDVPYDVPLSAHALSVLRDREKARTSGSVYVFPSPKDSSKHITEKQHAWDELRERAGIPDIRMHDLRRTLGSWMASSGTSLQFIGRALGHKSSAATRRYAQFSLEPVRNPVSAATDDMVAAANRPQLPSSR